MWKFKHKNGLEIVVDDNAKNLCERDKNYELVGEVDKDGKAISKKKADKE